MPLFDDKPLFTTFNASFENKYDSFFLQLNRVDNRFLPDADETVNCAENEEGDDGQDEAYEPIDPRTKQLAEPAYAVSIQRVPTFTSTSKSTLSKQEQQGCLRVLLYDFKPPNRADLETWQTTTERRHTEKVEMLQAVHAYEQSQKELIYEPVMALFVLYKSWYRRLVQPALHRARQEPYYTTRCGLPNMRAVAQCYKTASITQLPKLVHAKGDILLISSDNDDLPALSALHYCLPNYLARTPMPVEPAPPAASEVSDDYDVFLPMEALLFLLTAGDYPDLPTEMFLQIKQTESGAQRLHFERPLPARICGRHTNSMLLEDAYQTYLATTQRGQWLRLNGLKNIERQKETTTTIIDGKSGGIKRVKYKLKPIEDFLQPHPTPTQRTNTCYVLWQLSAPEAADLQLLTTHTLAASYDESLRDRLSSRLIKLESKPQFGCEWLTKYELIRAWFELRLLGDAEEGSVGHCERIAPADFRAVLTEKLSLASVAHYLRQLYRVDVTALLGGLFSMLSSLRQSPPGRYLLRYSDMYAKNFLLCAPSVEPTKYNLAEQLDVEANHLKFLCELQALPIADHLVSEMHRRYELLPCAFPAQQRKPAFGDAMLKAFITKPPVTRKKAKAAAVGGNKRRKTGKKRTKLDTKELQSARRDKTKTDSGSEEESK